MNFEKIKQNIQFPLLVFFVSRAIFLIPALISLYFLLPYRNAPPAGHHLYHGGSQHPNFWINAVQKWDAYWFLNVTREGYYWFEVPTKGENNQEMFDQATNITIFPLLPFLMKTLSFGFLDISIIGVLICNLSFALALIYLFKYLKDHMELEIARRTILYFSLFPIAFIYSSIYSESLFILLSVLVFYFVDKKEYLFAGLCAMLLTASRTLGIIIIPALLAWLFMDYIRYKKFSLGILIPIIMAPVGIILFFLWVFHVSGHWNGYFLAQKAWGKSLGTPWNLLEYVFSIFRYNGLDFHKIMPDAFFIFPVSLFSLWKFHKVSLPLATFWIAGLILSLSATSMVGFSRYTGVLFPMFIPLAQLGKNKWIHWIILGIFLTVGNFCVIGWTNWYFSF